MLEVKKYSVKGEELGTVSLPESLFACESSNKAAVMYEVVKMYLANQRQGTSCVKNRVTAKGSGRKLYRQKGTGNARAGNLRTPLRVGGGVAFGPRPHNWYKKIPKKKKSLALKLALTEKAKGDDIIVIESLTFDKPNTKKAKDIMASLSVKDTKTLLLIDGSERSIVRSFANLPNVMMDRADSVFAYEVLNCKKLLITEDALKKMEEVFTS